jgi:hypothetical protein
LNGALPGSIHSWRAEEALLRGDIRADAAALDKLLAEDFHEIGQSGIHWTRSSMIDALTADGTSGHLAYIDERRADRLAEDLVLLTYRLEFDGRRSRRSSIWRVDGEYARIEFHQGSRVQ